MAIIGLITNVGLAESIEAQNNQGWKIYPENFGVSETKGALDPTRTTANTMWFTNVISSRVVVNANTIEFICTIPPGATGSIKYANEIYLFAKDQQNNEFLLALAQPEGTILYDPVGATTFRLLINIASIDISSLYQFNYTQATEIDEHNTDPNAHDGNMPIGNMSDVEDTEITLALDGYILQVKDGTGGYMLRYVKVIDSGSY